MRNISYCCCCFQHIFNSITPKRTYKNKHVLLYIHKITTKCSMHRVIVAVTVLADIIAFNFVAPAKFDDQHLNDPRHSAQGHEYIQYMENQQIILRAVSYIAHDWPNYKHCIALCKHEQAIAASKAATKKGKRKQTKHVNPPGAVVLNTRQRTVPLASSRQTPTAAAHVSKCVKSRAQPWCRPCPQNQWCHLELQKYVNW